MMADDDILKGNQAQCALIGWRSSSLMRVARSGAAAQAASNGQEDLEYTGLAYYEMSRVPVDLESTWELMPTPMLDKFAAIDALALRQVLRWSGIELRWIHSQAVIGDALTKCSSAAWQRLDRVLQTSSSGLVGDLAFVSSKKPK